MANRRVNDPLSYQSRDYRHEIDSSGLPTLEVKVRETDLFIATDAVDAYSIALKSVTKCRTYIEEYGKINPGFLDSLSPIPFDAFGPEIVREMLFAANEAGVGPMAAVAGAISEFVARDLLNVSHEVIVENGGDIYLKRSRDVLIRVFAGQSPLSNKVVIRIKSAEMPLGICTSSGTVGHSLSLGHADAVCVISKSAILADAAATAAGNLVKSTADIRKAIEHGSQIRGVLGLLVIMEDRMGAWGAIEIA